MAIPASVNPKRISWYFKYGLPIHKLAAIKKIIKTFFSSRLMSPNFFKA